MTLNQWLVISLLIAFVSAIIWEIALYRIMTYDERDYWTDPPPIIGGLVFGFLTTVAIATIIGIVNGLIWLWNN